MCGCPHQKDHNTDCFDLCNNDILVPVFSDLKIPGLVMVPPATPSKRKISWRCYISKMCLRSLQLRNVLVWFNQIIFFTHHLVCVARSVCQRWCWFQVPNHIELVTLERLPVVWSRRQTDQGWSIPTKAPWSRRHLITRASWSKWPYCFVKSEFVAGLRSQICLSDSNKCQKLTACSTSCPSKSFVKCAIVLRATQDHILLSDVNLWQVWEVRSICQI